VHEFQQFGFCLGVGLGVWAAAAAAAGLEEGGGADFEGAVGEGGGGVLGVEVGEDVVLGGRGWG